MRQTLTGIFLLNLLSLSFLACQPAQEEFADDVAFSATCGITQEVVPRGSCKVICGIPIAVSAYCNVGGKIENLHYAPLTEQGTAYYPCTGANIAEQRAAAATSAQQNVTAIDVNEQCRLERVATEGTLSAQFYSTTCNGTDRFVVTSCTPHPTYDRLCRYFNPAGVMTAEKQF